ncbi:unnamed protein product, partial [Ectocarpus sp. 6 AP-2014]
MARLVDSLLRGRAQASARHEAATAVSDIRTFVHAWRPDAPASKDEQDSTEPEGRGRTRSNGSGGSDPSMNRPSADTLLKLAQRGVQLHNNARKLYHARNSGGGGTSGGPGACSDWKSATEAYLRAAAASLVSLGSTSSSKDCGNLCRLFSKAGELLVEDAGDDIRA